MTEKHCPTCGRFLDESRGELVNAETGECHFCYEEKIEKEKQRLIDSGKMIRVEDEGTLGEMWVIDASE